MENLIFWSEIGQGFLGPGGKPPPNNIKACSNGATYVGWCCMHYVEKAFMSTSYRGLPTWCTTLTGSPCRSPSSSRISGLLLWLRGRWAPQYRFLSLLGVACFEDWLYVSSRPMQTAVFPQNRTWNYSRSRPLRWRRSTLGKRWSPRPLWQDSG